MKGVKREGCLVEECNNKHFGLGYCEKHYRKFKRYGDPSIAKIEKHGMKKTPEYQVWCNLKSRCCNPNDKFYKDYGDRGIQVCNRWLHSFVNFYEDMGDKPFKKATIDRENNNEGYSKDNCRWVTSAMNAQNRSTTKLTMKKAQEIRVAYSKGNITYKKLGKLFKVSITAIRKVINNQNWSVI